MPHFKGKMAGKLGTLSASSEILYSQKILGTVNDFRKQGFLCDVTINVHGGRKHVAHSTMLAASSHYFRKLFTFNSQPKTSFDVQLEWLHSEDMEVILDYIYTGEIKLTEDDAEDILTAAAYLFIEGLPEVVVEFLQEHLNLLSCFSVLSLADKHSFQALKSSCTRFVSSNFVQASNSPAFLCLRKNLLEEVVSSNDLMLAREEDVFRAIVRWIKHDLENRASHFADLFSCVRLQGIPKDVLLKTVAREALVQQNAMCIARVQEELMTASDDQSHANPIITSYRECVDAAVLCGGTSSKYVTQNLKNTVCFVPSLGKWFELPNMLHGQNGHTTAVCNTDLYSIGHCSVFNQESSREVQRYAPGVNTWGTCASMPVGRCFAASVTFQGQVYVFGGILHKDDCKRVSAEVSRYNPAVDKWYPVTSMNCARQGLCAVAVNGNIFAIGGCDPDDNYLSTVERYEPQHDQWTRVSSMVKRRAFSSAAVVNSNKVLVIGGRENEYDSGILDCCETFDLATGQWNLEPVRLRTARCAAGICKVANQVFVFGGESEDDALDSVECWDAQERQWSIVTHMPFSAFHVQAEVLSLPKDVIIM